VPIYRAHRRFIGPLEPSRYPNLSVKIHIADQAYSAAHWMNVTGLLLFGCKWIISSAYYTSLPHFPLKKHPWQKQIYNVYLFPYRK